MMKTLFIFFLTAVSLVNANEEPNGEATEQEYSTKGLKGRLDFILKDKDGYVQLTISNPTDKTKTILFYQHVAKIETIVRDLRSKEIVLPLPSDPIPPVHLDRKIKIEPGKDFKYLYQVGWSRHFANGKIYSFEIPTYSTNAILFGWNGDRAQPIE